MNSLITFSPLARSLSSKLTVSPKVYLVIGETYQNHSESNCPIGNITLPTLVTMVPKTPNPAHKRLRLMDFKNSDKYDVPMSYTIEEYEKWLREVELFDGAEYYLQFDPYEPGKPDPTEQFPILKKNNKEKNFVNGLSTLDVIPIIICDPYRQFYHMAIPGLFCKGLWDKRLWKSPCVLTPDGLKSPFELGFQFYPNGKNYKNALKVALKVDGKVKYYNFANLFAEQHKYRFIAMPYPRPTLASRKGRPQSATPTRSSSLNELTINPSEESSQDDTATEASSRRDDDEEEPNLQSDDDTLDPTSTRDGEDAPGLNSGDFTGGQEPIVIDPDLVNEGLPRNLYEDPVQLRTYLLNNRPLAALADDPGVLGLAFNPKVLNHYKISTVKNLSVEFFWHGIPCKYCTPYFPTLGHYFYHRKEYHNDPSTRVDFGSNYNHCPPCAKAKHAAVVFETPLDYFSHFHKMHYPKLSNSYFWDGPILDILQRHAYTEGPFVEQHKTWMKWVNGITPFFK